MKERKFQKEKIIIIERKKIYKKNKIKKQIPKKEKIE